MRLTFTVIILLFWLSACQDVVREPGSPLSASDIFNRYLTEHFGSEIPASPHCFILVPRLGCQGCMQQALVQLNALHSEELPSSLTLVVSNRRNEITRHIANDRFRVLWDHNGQLDQLALQIANMMIIHTNQHQIISTIRVTPQNQAQLKEMLKGKAN